MGRDLVGTGRRAVTAVPILVTTGCAVVAAGSGPALDACANRLRRSPSGCPNRQAARDRRGPAGTLVLAVVGAGLLAPSWQLFVALMIGAVLLVIAAMVDIAERRIPNRLTYPATVTCLAIAGVAVLSASSTDAAWSALVAAAVFSSLLLVIHLARPDGMGLGDVKLAFPLGFGIGWVVEDAALAPAAVGFALTAASLVGLTFAVSSAVRTSEFRARPSGPESGPSFRGTSLPFGPALSLGGSLTMALALGFS